MARFGKNKKALDPRVAFALEPGSSIFDLSSGLRVLINYNQPTLKPRDFMIGLDMQDVLTTDISVSTIPTIFGNPLGWRSTKTGTPSIVPGNLPVGNWITHASEGSTVSFWFKNNASAPISSTIALSSHVFISTRYLPAPNFSAPPSQSKFTVYCRDVPGALGEEFAIGWNHSNSPRHYLSTRNALTYRSSPYAMGDNGFLSTEMCDNQPINVMKYGEWHHVAIVTKMGKTFLPSQLQGDSTDYGNTAVYLNGQLVNTFVGFSWPGDSFKPWGSSLVEKYMPSTIEEFGKIAPAADDVLWFPYNPATNNRSYYQYSAWNRVLGPEEIYALYKGTINGVYTDALTSYSAPPRKQRNSQSRIVKTVNLGFDDSHGPKSNLPFNDNRSLPDYMEATLGSNVIIPKFGTNIGFFGNDDPNLRTGITDKVPTRLSTETIGKMPDEYRQSPYTERLDKEDLNCADGSTGQAIIRIPISSVSSSINAQIAGRSDSKLAKTVTTTTQGSLFMSSAFRHDTGIYSSIVSGKRSSVAGTGFMYYSPRFKCWVEKRQRNWALADGGTIDDADSERADAVNSIELNAAPFDTPDIHNVLNYTVQKVGSDYVWALSDRNYQNHSGSLYNVARVSASLFTNNSPFPHSGTAPHPPAPSATGPIPVTTDYAVSASFSSRHFATGVNEVMAQFTSSPQAAYFLPFKEHLEHLGYSSIGTPTTAFGAPFSSRYHANDTETIKLSEFIDRPFKLKKVIMRIPVKVVRRNDIEETGISSGFDFEWAKNVSARRDMDNYVFFLYRQVRTNIGEVRDSATDMSSSIRFLIASSSVCVYNSPSFGRAYNDGFSDIFGQNTPIVTSGTEPPIDSNLNELYSSCLVSGKDPLTGQALTYWNRPLHTPSVELDASLSDFSVGSQTFEKTMTLQVEMTPAITLGGMSNASLMYVTTSTGMHSTSFWYGESGDPSGIGKSGRNQLFNRYPYTGTFATPNDKNAVPPITTVFQNFWLGGTRQPIVNNNAKNFNELTSSTDAALKIAPYFAFMNTDTRTYTSRSQWFNGKTTDGEAYFDPNFDIEVGRTGLSMGTIRDNIFSKPVGIVTDGRSVTTAFSDKAVTKTSAVFQRTNLITFESVETENLDTTAAGAALYLTDSMTSIGTLSGSNMADLVSSFTTGYFVASPNTNKQIQRDYILLPTDELVLGLDAGISPPPDITPTYDDPHPDALGGIDPILVITVP